MWTYYNDKCVLVTGGSGFLGTAIVYRLLTSSPACHVYLICRGGAEKLRRKWSEWLPLKAVEELCDSCRLTVYDGDILQPDMKLLRTELETLRSTINIIIHAASSISLAKPLHRVSKSIIGASEAIAKLSFTCNNLERFVYISTAYANAHLFPRSEGPLNDVEIKEEFYNLEKQGNPVDEWNEVQKHGTSEAYESEDFPWAYAYAKHLTERLLFHNFCQFATKENLLIVRPSIIGPAQSFPFPGYSMPMSTPSTMLAAAIALNPSWRWKIATRMALPEITANADEVPVDVVVDRLLSHLAAGGYGCIHAVSGKRARLIIQEWWASATKLRRIPWTARPLWLAADWKSQEQHRVSRLYVILGASFAFSEDRTLALSHDLAQQNNLNLQLFTCTDLDDYLTSREGHVRYVMDKFAQNSKWAWLIVQIFYRNFGHK